ncbi:AAA family ATPase [Algisphaera agarilytica]|uniref:Cellulose biosynthesis protein BcsQ n=1 Tax=Algisphaera agarilytica TaxID=1385975 RepID=A0A7X0H5K8_9BACT|nr:AAA family ATPase [Algisphaera agarilytica]MBB6429701.1 cellulose biosynthesis protein BcsQ [Algisphaera agarilytica]
MPDPIDVYLLAGQSNMSGSGQSHELPDVLKAPHASARIYFAPLNSPGNERLDRPHVRQWSALAPNSGEHPGGFGLELSLGHTLAARSNTPVALIKSDRGGTSLYADWRPEDHDDPSTLTNLMLAASAEAWESLLEEGLNPRLAGIIWYQGESDTSLNNPDPHAYSQQLQTIFELISDELNDGQPAPKTIVRIRPATEPNHSNDHVIRQLQVQVAQADPMATWINTDDLHQIEGDAWHVNGQSLLTLGDRAAEALLTLLPPGEGGPQSGSDEGTQVAVEPSVPDQVEPAAAVSAETDAPTASEPTPEPPHPSPIPAEGGTEPAASQDTDSIEDEPAASEPETPKSEIASPKSLEPLPKPDATRVLALMNQKGGVGKTTTAVNVGAALANLGLNVLCIDLDPQAHLTLSLGIEPDEIEKSNYDLFTDPETTAMEVVRYTARDDKRLAVLPAETNLAGVESELSDMIATGLAQTILRNKCKDLIQQFDYVLIDCPPSLGLLTINALTLASQIVVPMQAHFLALQGMTKLFETIGMVRQGINPNLTVAGVVLCMHEGNTLLASEVIGELEGFFEAARGTTQPWAEGQVFQPPVRRNIKLAEAPSFGQSVHAYAPDSNGAKDYLALARSIAGG